MTTKYGTLAADGSTAAFTLHAGDVVHAYGDFGGGTLTLQLKIGGNWYALKNEDATSAFAVTDDASCVIENGTLNCRLTLSGATAPDIDWEIA